jgi:hypothetical protein
MSAGALRERLDRQLDLLSGGRVDVPERQRTMRAAIAWSFDLLRASDQAMLSELSLFAAPATLDAIARVNGAGEAEAIDGLTRLIDASLVRLRAADGRYWLLEPVRQFAAERLLAEFDQATAARARFCDWYYETATSFFDQDADAFQEYDNAVLFFSGEVENTVRALAYLTDAGEWDRAVRLVFDALGVIDMFGASDITSEWVAEARANGRFVSQRSAAMVAILAAEMGPYPGALATHLEAVAACRSADEPWLLRIALRDLAFVALDQAELDVAEGAIRDYAETELVTPYHLMLREILRGRFAMLCERPDEGAAHLRAAEQIARRSDEQFLVAKCLRETAKGYLCGGDADAALLSAQEGIAASDRGRLPMVDLQCRLVVARAMMSLDPPPKERIAPELVAAGQLVGGIRDQYVDFASALILHLTAGVLALEGLDDRAAYLAGAAQNTLASWPTEPDVAGLRAAQRPIDIARERIGYEEWQRCARMGAAASRSEALDTASDWLTETMSDPVESLNP